MRASVGGSVLEAVEFGHRSVEADLKSLDLAEPAVGADLADAFAEVLDDLDKAGPLAGVQLENGAANAGLSELEGRLDVTDVASNSLALRRRSERNMYRLDPAGDADLSGASSPSPVNTSVAASLAAFVPADPSTAAYVRQWPGVRYRMSGGRSVRCRRHRKVF
ncbi:hypothetical protein ACWCQQ_29410 [Streptomyces sp. NPDC002143]